MRIDTTDTAALCGLELFRRISHISGQHPNHRSRRFPSAVKRQRACYDIIRVRPHVQHVFTKQCSLFLSNDHAAIIERVTYPNQNLVCIMWGKIYQTANNKNIITQTTSQLESNFTLILLVLLIVDWSTVVVVVAIECESRKNKCTEWNCKHSNTSSDRNMCRNSLMQ